MGEWFKRNRKALTPDARDFTVLCGIASLGYGGEHLAQGLGFLLAGVVLVFVALR